MNADSVYHEGELAVQDRAGVRDMASRIGRGIRTDVPDAAAAFLAAQRFAILGWIDTDGHVWASVLTGEPGFLSAPDPRTVRVAARPIAGDPLEAAWPSPGSVGLVAIDFAARRRMRVNGAAFPAGDDAIEIRPRQVYSNCPKYIQAREPFVVADPVSHVGPTVSTELTPKQRVAVESADTFFVASYHAEGGADASHRGGLPGFVRVENATTLVWPDFEGNTMFQTLGNVEADGRVGLLFVDYDTGSTLQLSGRARVVWSGDDRLTEFHVERVVEIPEALPLRWRFVDYSPFL